MHLFMGHYMGVFIGSIYRKSLAQQYQNHRSIKAALEDRIKIRHSRFPQAYYQNSQHVLHSGWMIFMSLAN